MVLEAVLRIENAGNPPLRVLAVGLLETFFGDNRDIQPGIDGQSGSQSSEPTTDDQDVGEMVRHPLGMEGNQVAWSGILH